MEANWAARRAGSSRSSSLVVDVNSLFSSSMMESQTGGLPPWLESDSSLNRSGQWSSESTLFIEGEVEWLRLSVGGGGGGGVALALFRQSTVIGVVRAEPFSTPDLKKWVLTSSTSTTVGDIGNNGLERGSISSALSILMGLHGGLEPTISPISGRFNTLMVGLIGLVTLFVGLSPIDLLEPYSCDKLFTSGPCCCCCCFILTVLVTVFMLLLVLAGFTEQLGVFPFWAGKTNCLGREITIGLLLLPCCNRPASAKNCSAVIVTTRGLDLTVPDASLNLFTEGCWMLLALATTGTTLFVCFNAILPASETITSVTNVTISMLFPPFKPAFVCWFIQHKNNKIERESLVIVITDMLYHDT